MNSDITTRPIAKTPAKAAMIDKLAAVRQELADHRQFLDQRLRRGAKI